MIESILSDSIDYKNDWSKVEYELVEEIKHDPKKHQQPEEQKPQKKRIVD